MHFTSEPQHGRVLTESQVREISKQNNLKIQLTEWINEIGM